MSSKYLITFPLKHNQDVPDVKNWKYVNKVIPYKFKNYNIGMITGEYNNITIFELEVYKWSKEHSFIEAFGKDYIKRFNTRTIKTANGQYHLYFEYNYNILTTKNKDVQIKIRNDGAYVPIPPSSINYDKYEVINDSKIKKCPEELYNYYCDYIIKSSKKSNIKGALSKNEVNCSDMNNCLLNFNLESKDWIIILNRLNNKYLDDFNDWYKATLASKYLGFKKEWNDWSKNGKKYNYVNNMKVWNSIHHFDRLKTFNTVNMIIKNDDNSVKFYLKDKYYGKCFYRPHIENVDGFIEINKPKLDDINKPERFFKYDHNYIIKSDTGTGKTTAFKKYIQYIKTPFISIVSRVCLGSEYYRSFKDEGVECEFYYNKKFDFGYSLIITPESLPYIVNYDFSKYVVFLDEFNSIIEHILSSSTMNNNRVLVLFMIQKMIRTCKYFIAVDADISYVAMKFVKSTGVKYRYYKNIYKHFNGVDVYFDKDYYEFYDKLKAEDKFILSCDSKKNADTFHKMLCKDGIENIKLITSDLLPSEEIDLDKYDKIIFSPKVIYGLDSTMERPVYGLFKGETILPTQMIQYLARCRNPSYINIFFECVQSTYPEYESMSDACSKLYMEINASCKIYRTLEQYEQKCLKENGLEYDILKDDDDDRLFKLMYNASTKIYIPLKRLYNYKVDTYNTNKYIHLYKILRNRGFNVMVDRQLPTKIKGGYIASIIKELKNEKIEKFEYENEHIYRRINILGIPKESIDEYLKEFLIDNYSLYNYFNYASFKRKNKFTILSELKDRRDFEDEKFKSDKNKIVLLFDMLYILGLSKFEINYKRKNEISNKYRKIGKRYVETVGARMKKPIETDIELHGAIIKLYKYLFGCISSKWGKAKKEDVRYLKVSFTKKKDLFERVYEFYYNDDNINLYKTENLRLDY